MNSNVKKNLTFRTWAPPALAIDNSKRGYKVLQSCKAFCISLKQAIKSHVTICCQLAFCHVHVHGISTLGPSDEDGRQLIYILWKQLGCAKSFPIYAFFNSVWFIIISVVVSFWDKTFSVFCLCMSFNMSSIMCPFTPVSVSLID